MPSEERPRSEPEIIPPDRVHEDDLRRANRIWMSAEDGSHRVYVRRIGPLGTLLLAAAVGGIAILLLLLVVGAFLIWIPIVGLLVATLILSSLLRSLFNRPR
jgi:hypothetical protein